MLTEIFDHAVKIISCFCEMFDNATCQMTARRAIIEMQYFTAEDGLTDPNGSMHMHTSLACANQPCTTHKRKAGSFKVQRSLHIFMCSLTLTPLMLSTALHQDIHVHVDSAVTLVGIYIHTCTCVCDMPCDYTTKDLLHTEECTRSAGKETHRQPFLLSQAVFDV